MISSNLSVGDEFKIIGELYKTLFVATENGKGTHVWNGEKIVIKDNERGRNEKNDN